LSKIRQFMILNIDIKKLIKEIDIEAEIDSTYEK
jgi:hypothetical protein